MKNKVMQEVLECLNSNHLKESEIKAFTRLIALKLLVLDLKVILVFHSEVLLIQKSQTTQIISLWTKTRYTASCTTLFRNTLLTKKKTERILPKDAVPRSWEPVSKVNSRTKSTSVEKPLKEIIN
jgi:hypothetical protein